MKKTGTFFGKNKENMIKRKPRLKDVYSAIFFFENFKNFLLFDHN